MLAVLLLFAPVAWALTTFGRDLPDLVFAGLLPITYISILMLFNYVSRPIFEREDAKNLQALRISPARIEYFGRQEILSCASSTDSIQEISS